MLEDLREIFYQQATLSNWKRLCALFEAPDNPRLAVAIDYAQGLMARWAWPDHLRIAPQSWVERACQRGHEPRLRLTRVVSVDFIRALDVEQARNLGQCPGMVEVTALDISHKNLGDAGLEALLEGMALANLRRLELGFNALTNDALPRLCHHAGLPSLRALNLRSNPVNAWRSIAPPSLLDRLESLNLTDTSLDHKGLRALIHDQPMPALRELSLSGNRLGDEGLSALAEAPWLPQLEELALDDVGRNLVEGRQRLLNAASPQLRTNMTRHWR